MKIERGQPERLHEREIDEQADREAGRGPDRRAAQQPDEGDDERGEVDRDAEHGHLRDDADLEEHDDDHEHGDPREQRSGERHPPALVEAEVSELPSLPALLF